MVKKNTKMNEYGYTVAVIGGAIFVAIILGLVAGRPLYQSVKKTNAELKEKKLVLEKLEQNLENLKTLDSKKAELEEKNEKVLSALPADKDVPRLFVQMERIASSAGMQITSIAESGSVDTEASNPAGIITPLYYSVTGTTNDYASLKQALLNIEDGLRLVTVDKMAIDSDQSGRALTVNFTVKTYSRGQK